MAGDRGSYRAVKVVLLDGPDYQDLPERARHLFLVLKLSFGPSGIEVQYPQALAIELAAKSGMPMEVVGDVLDVLEVHGWIHRERNVLWIVGQLEHDPHMNWKDTKHRTSIWRHVAGLPRLPIVGAFMAAHEDWFQERTYTATLRGGKSEERSVEAAPDDLQALLADAAIPNPPSAGPKKALNRAIAGPDEALRSTDNRVPSTDERVRTTTVDKSTGAGAPSADATGGVLPDWSKKKPALGFLVPELAQLIRKHLWLGSQPPPQVVEREPKWTEGREADVVRCWLRDGDVADLDEAKAVIRFARHALEMEDRPFSLLFLHAEEGRGRFSQALGYAQKQLEEEATKERGRRRTGAEGVGDVMEAVRG